jgi:hypothetical protein
MDAVSVLLLRQCPDFVEVHQIGPFVMLLSDLLVDAVSCLLLRRHLVSGTTVMGLIFGCCQSFVAEAASWWGYTKLYRKIPWDVYRGMELP